MAPQSPQKRLLGGFSTLHLGQRFSSSAPQSPQNFLLTGFSLPQLEQRIGSPVITAIRASFIVLQEVRSPDAVADIRIGATSRVDKNSCGIRPPFRPAAEAPFGAVGQYLFLSGDLRALHIAGVNSEKRHLTAGKITCRHATALWARGCN